MATPSKFSIEGKVFVVVGGGRGIGRGIVEVLAEAGCRGAVVAATPTYVLPFAERVSKETGNEVMGFAVDGKKTAELDKVAAAVLKKFGKIDVWVNAVGDSIEEPLVPLPRPDGTMQPKAPISDETFRHILDLNFTTIHAGCRAVGPHFIERRQGRVINVGSCLARRGGKYQTTYVAAKCGIEGFTHALALEWAPFGITVNCVAPGSFPDFDTLTPDVIEDRHAQAKKNVPLGRVGQLREVGYLVQYLASDAASYVTGQVIGIDGGIVL